MLLYLAGLKGVDMSLREAARVDGASEKQTFFKIDFPVMAPINIIVLVVSVIESLRAFDLVWVINKGRNGLELIATLVTQNIVGEASRIGFGSALATFMLIISSIFITLPLCRPPLAALATTWIYNEFFWATVLLQQGDKFPVTSSLNNLRGQFFTDNNLVAAGSVLVALPTLIIFFVLQKQFVSGLTLGATKG